MLTVWWSRTPQPGNFGDILTPVVLSHYGIEHRWETRKAAQAMCIGSIIGHARAGQIVMGSGAMWANDRPHPEAQYLWVRGPLTAAAVEAAGGECPQVYGDPAMLLPRVFPRDADPVHEIGVFPHYVDLPRFRQAPNLINPLMPVREVLRRLWSCDRIVSSSLHGIIAAHAYGIPAAWVQFSDKLDGDGTKFHDHALSVGLSGMPLSTLDDMQFTTGKYDDTAIDAILRRVAA
jgi:hypothetical protein